MQALSSRSIILAGKIGKVKLIILSERKIAAASLGSHAGRDVAFFDRPWRFDTPIEFEQPDPAKLPDRAALPPMLEPGWR